MSNQVIQTDKTISLTNYPHPVQELNNFLTAFKPDNSETTRMITYVLIGTVVAGLLVYQYIKSQERNEL